MDASFDEDWVRLSAAGDPTVERHFADYFGRLLRIDPRRRRGPSEDVGHVCQGIFWRDAAAHRKSARQSFAAPIVVKHGHKPPLADHPIPQAKEGR